MPEVPYLLAGKRVWVAGHRGMVGSALVRRLASEGCAVLTASRSDADLTRQNEVEAWMGREQPQAIFVAAAKVGGILANSTYPADFLYQNLMIEANIIHAAHEIGVEKLMFLGSSCIYPKFSPQPISEDALLTGLLEPTNEAYAIAKIAGLKLCEMYRQQYSDDFISAMPTNLYGPEDNFDLSTSHVLPALVAKFATAKREGRGAVEIWGSGTARREFLHVDDCADALVFLMKHYSGAQQVNVGSGIEISIGDLACLVGKVVGFDGEIRFDLSKPDGTPRKLLDNSMLIKAGWKPLISLSEGVSEVYRWYRETIVGDPAPTLEADAATR